MAYKLTRETEMIVSGMGLAPLCVAAALETEGEETDYE